MEYAKYIDIEAIVFDWGDTLVRVPGLTTDAEAHFACVKEFFEEEFIHLASTEIPSYDWVSFQDCYRTAALSLVEESVQTGQEFGFELRLARTIQMLDDNAEYSNDRLAYLARKLSKKIIEHCSIVDGSLDVVHELNPRYKLGLLSNYPSTLVVRHTIKQFEHQAHFDAIVISADIGVVKPFKQSFDAVVSRLGVEAMNVLFVGDDLTNDMLGAKNRGMKTAWLPRNGQSGEYEFVDILLGSISELPDQLFNKN